MATKIDFKDLADRLLDQIDRYIGDFIPGGKYQGKEYTAATVNGGKGNSFSINIRTGLWKDFATNESGRDLINHYALVKNLTQIEAAKDLQEWLGVAQSPPTRKPIPRNPPLDTKVDIGPPPAGAPEPEFRKSNGNPPAVWVYRSEEGVPTFYIQRIDNGKERIYLPYSWDRISESWVNKHYPKPRPMYNLHQLNGHDYILVCEGEKSADAAEKIIESPYAFMSWPGGANAYQHVDWGPVAGKKILIWPDADGPGIEAAQGIVEKIKDLADEIKIIIPPRGTKIKWDAADALEEGWDRPRWLRWAKENITTIKEATKSRPKPPPPEPTIPPKVQPAGKLVPEKTEDPKVIRLVLADEFEPPRPEVLHILRVLKVERKSDGTPIPNAANVVKILKGVVGKSIWYDEFHNKIYTDYFGEVKQWNDWNDIYILEYMQSRLAFHNLGITHVQQGVIKMAYSDVRNEPRDWINTLKWDGEPRVMNFFHKSCGTPDTDYHKTVSKNFWISMVARIMRPGCKVDNMVVLEGEQGSLKSSLLREIGGKWFAEQNASILEKDFMVCLHGKILIELAELDAFNKIEVNTIKKIISNEVDTYRMPYARTAQDYPRQGIFVGTTNEDNYLRDNTGARRFWPIAVRKIDLEWVKEFREQLFAEARTLFSEGVTWWDIDQKTAEREQELRRSYDDWEGVIDDTFAADYDSLNGISISKIAKDALDIDPNKMEKRTQMRIAGCLKVLGWKKRKVAGKVLWFRKNNLTDDNQEDNIQ